MEARLKRPRIAFVVAEQITVRAFLAGQLREMAKRFDITVVAHSADPDFLGGLGIEGEARGIAIRRNIHPAADLKALAELTLLFRRGRFDAVHSVTPKAGLLAMTAAKLAGVPVRTHMFTGQVWATRQGVARRVLKGFDRFIHRLTTFTLVDSPSQRDFLISEAIVRPEHSAVLAEGSICGVDVERFRPDPDLRALVRRELDIGPEQPVFLFLGRLKVDKGILDLAEAFATVHRSNPQTRLVLVGPDEDALAQQVRTALGEAASALRLVGGTAEPERYMAAADVFCLPSYREGFGSVLLEAAAAGIPSVASRIYGITDAVEDGVTGILHRPADPVDIAIQMIRLANDSALRLGMGEAARRRARHKFSSERLTKALVDYYDKVLPGYTAEVACTRSGERTR